LPRGHYVLTNGEWATWCQTSARAWWTDADQQHRSGGQQYDFSVESWI